MNRSHLRERNREDAHEDMCTLERSNHSKADGPLTTSFLTLVENGSPNKESNLLLILEGDFLGGPLICNRKHVSQVAVPGEESPGNGWTLRQRDAGKQMFLPPVSSLDLRNEKFSEGDFSAPF